MNKLKLYFDKLHLNFIKELITILVVNLISLVLGVTLFIIYKSINYLILTIVIFIFLNCIMLYRYILINNKNNLKNLNEISDSFMYFYLDINNEVKPIVALENIKQHCSITLNDNINLLLDEIKKDKTTAPFIKFSNKYPSIILETLVLSIYQLINEYNLVNITNFNKTYKEYKTKVEEIYSSTYKKQFSFITLTPVIGTMVITTIVIIATILIVRGYVNG